MSNTTELSTTTTATTSEITLSPQLAGDLGLLGDIQGEIDYLGTTKEEKARKKRLRKEAEALKARVTATLYPLLGQMVDAGLFDVMVDNDDVTVSAAIW